VSLPLPLPLTAQVNCGEVYDPLGTLLLHDVAPTAFPHAQWLRELELKHGRIAILASIGGLLGAVGPRDPGYSAVADPMENLNLYVTNFPFAFAQIILSIGLIEGAAFPGDMWFGKSDRAPGDIGYDRVGIKRKQTPDQAANVLLQELKNCRLAMMAMAAYMSELWIPGSVPCTPGHF